MESQYWQDGLVLYLQRACHRILSRESGNIPELDVEQEFNHVAILDDVFLAFTAQLASIAGGCP